MSNSRLIAVALTTLVLAACGSGANRAESDAAARWKTGLGRWDTVMTKAIDDLSVLLSETASLTGIQHRDARLEARLTVIEQTLFDCRKPVERLGRPPASFQQVHDDALLACKNLRLGAMLVRDGVRRMQIGLGSGVLTESSQPLGSGQDVLRRMRVELKHAG